MLEESAPLHSVRQADVQVYVETTGAQDGRVQKGALARGAQ
jgi:hypothetical protein